MFYIFLGYYRSNIFPLTLLAPVSLRTPLLNTHSAPIGQLTHAWASAAHCRVYSFQLASFLPRLKHQLCECVTPWCSVMSQSHKIEGGDDWRGVSGAAFSVGEESSRWSGLWGFLTIKVFDMTNFHNTIKTRKKWMKKKMSWCFPSSFSQKPSTFYLKRVSMNVNECKNNSKDKNKIQHHTPDSSCDLCYYQRYEKFQEHFYSHFLGLTR